MLLKLYTQMLEKQVFLLKKRFFFENFEIDCIFSIKRYTLFMTIYDIAKEAGVSASTVSRVINKKSCVSVKSAKKINAILKKYNFSPSDTARGLVNQSPKIIGILVSDIRNLHYCNGAYIIEQEFILHGYCSIIMQTGKTQDEQAIAIQRISSRKVDGLVLIGSTFMNEKVKNALSTFINSIPIVIVNGMIDLPNAYGILADEKKGIAESVSTLISKGKKHIAFVNGDNSYSNNIKLEGYLEGIKTHNFESLVVSTNSNDEGGYEITKDLMEKYPQTDAIIYAVDVLAAQSLRFFYDANIAVPEKVSVLGVDNSLFCLLTNPKLSSLDTKLQQVSLIASHTLYDAILKKDITKNCKIGVELIEREST